MMPNINGNSVSQNPSRRSCKFLLAVHQYVVVMNQKTTVLLIINIIDVSRFLHCIIHLRKQKVKNAGISWPEKFSFGWHSNLIPGRTLFSTPAWKWGIHLSCVLLRLRQICLLTFGILFKQNWYNSFVRSPNAFGANVSLDCCNAKEHFEWILLGSSMLICR